MSEQEWRKLLSTAWEIAHQAHANQVDKNGKPYLGHIMRVGARIHPSNIGGQIVAILHDTVEDSDGMFTLQTLEDVYGFPPRIVAALDAITHRKGETHSAYIERCRRDSLAAHVKRADLLDNLDPRRRYEGDAGLQKRYSKALIRLKQALTEDPVLQVDQGLGDYDLTRRAAELAREFAAMPSGVMNEDEVPPF